MAAAPSLSLPSRDKLLELFRGHWIQLGAQNFPFKMVFHYLGGKVYVDIYLEPEDQDEITMMEDYERQIEALLQELDWLGGVQYYWGAKKF